MHVTSLGRSSRLLSAVLLRFVASAERSESADQQQPPFRSGTKTVAVYATVSENNGRLAPDLTRDDFEIREDGKVRPLTIFASENQPITIVVMLDKSGSMRASYGLVRAGAEAFVRRLTAGDKARIGTFSNKIVMEPEEFTNNQDGLVRILRSGDRPEGPTPLWNAANEAVGALATQQGRRVVLLFTDGADNPGNLKTNNLTLMDVMERAQREDVMVYAIGLESRTPPQTGGGGMARGGLSGGFGGGNAFGIQRPDRGPADDRRGNRRRLFRAPDRRRPVGHLRARRRGTAPPVRARLRAREARWQDAQARGEGEEAGPEGAGAQALRGEQIGNRPARPTCLQRLRA